MDGRQKQFDYTPIRGILHDAIIQGINKVGDQHTFCFKVFDGWPILNQSDSSQLKRCGYYETIGPDAVIEPEYARCGDDKMLGDEILKSLQSSTMEDAYSFGSVSNQMVRTALLAWIGKDNATFAGLAIITQANVYFCYTELQQLTELDFYFAIDTPYYVWKGIIWGYFNALNDAAVANEGNKRVIDEIRAYNREYEHLGSDYHFDNEITFFRIKISPDRLKGDCCVSSVCP